MPMVANPVNRVWRYVAAVLLLLFAVFPLYWMLTTSVKPFREIFVGTPTLFPREIVFKSYVDLFVQTNMLRHTANSVYVALMCTTATLLLSTMVAYSITRYEHRLTEVVAQLMLFTYMVPSIVLLIPLYILLKTLGLINTYTGLVLSYMTFTLPFAIWMQRSFFQSIPKSLEEAASIDGANRFQSFFRIVLPQAVPGLISTALFVFMLCWGEYLYAQVLLSVEVNKTVPLTLSSLTGGGQNINFGLLMAGSVVATLPILLIFVLLQKYVLRGFLAGNVD